MAPTQTLLDHETLEDLILDEARSVPPPVMVVNDEGAFGVTTIEANAQAVKSLVLEDAPDFAAPELSAVAPRTLTLNSSGSKPRKPAKPSAKIYPSVGANETTASLAAAKSTTPATSGYGEMASQEAADFATNGLYDRDPLLSAKTTFTPAHRNFFIILGVLALAFGIWRPLGLLNVFFFVFSIAFLISTAFKYYVSVKGAHHDVVEQVTDEQVAALSDDDLPIYTVLLPVFREPNIVAQLIKNLGNMDYPVDKTEVLILTEEVDTETREAIARSNPPANFRTIIVPEGEPQTKPRACNVGLQICNGEYLVIYDAEDRPDPDQLKKALIAFRAGGNKTAVVQAALNYYNYSENFLTRMFSLEYSYWFDYMLPGLDDAKFPIPLGGTSNHFDVRILKELGGWDPYNVTEDADLGIRTSALGYEVAVINSTTWEEANTQIPNFIRQRSRWIKGFMLTTLVHARQPLKLLRTVGVKNFFGFVALIAGTPISFLAVLPFMLLTIVTMVLGGGVMTQVFHPWILWLSIINFVLGSNLVVYLCLMAPYKRANFRLTGWAMLNPYYWVIHSISAYKALWQLLFNPHYWEKTNHGLTSHEQ